MHIPFITSLLKARNNETKRKLYRRKGGGGGGKGGGSAGGGKTGSTGSSGSSSSAGKSSTVPNSGSRSASTYGRGGGAQTTIPSGSAFAGRTQGGGTRDQVYGNQQYGSGYPGTAGAGVAGRGFPFVYWPLAWGGVAGIGGAAYYHNSEYGRPDNSSRPGGPMVAAAFVSNSTAPTTFRLVSDNQTVTALITEINNGCSSSLNTSASSTTPSLYADNPQPAAAIQYYRASSITLTLDGYNNTAVYSDDLNTPNSPLPTNIDTTLLNCLNTTIGNAAPLIDNSAMGLLSHSQLGLVGLVLAIWHLLSWVGL